MDSSVTGYSVQLDAWFRRDGRKWLAWCPAINVITQARTKKRAKESLREAVELWFESCIDRGVLDAALKEVGFTKVPHGEETPEGDRVNVVNVVRQSASQPITQKEMSFSLGHRKQVDYIEGIIPAYIATKQLGNTARASG